MRYLVADVDSVSIPGTRVGIAMPVQSKTDVIRWAPKLEQSILRADPRVDPVNIEWRVERRKE